VKVGTNFATTCDLLPQTDLFVTGHRGFNGSGSDVMLWNLKKLSEPLFTFSDHQFTPESVRFLNHEKPLIVSAAKDAVLHILSESGNSLATSSHETGFACMETLRTAHPKNENQRILVCADIRQKLLIYTFDIREDNN
jgi:hypothetical protein